MIKLSDSELEVMCVIWKKDKITSAEIIQELNKKNWKSSTIRTFISRLLDKKAIIVCEKNAKKYFYKSNIDKKEYLKKMTNDFIKKFQILENED